MIRGEQRRSAGLGDGRGRGLGGLLHFLGARSGGLGPRGVFSRLYCLEPACPRRGGPLSPSRGRGGAVGSRTRRARADDVKEYLLSE